MGGSDIFSKISNEYYRLTVSEKKVADYVVAHQEDTQFMSISDLAEVCGVAEATVSRFCRTLHFKGYNAFKLAVAQAAIGRESHGLTGEVLPDDSIEDMYQKLYTTHVEAISQTSRLLMPGALKSAVDLLVRARNVRTMGQGGSLIIAQEAAHLFSTVSSKFSCVVDSHTQVIAASLLGPEDVICYFSFSGATRELVDLMQLTRERKIPVILVTRFPKSPGALNATVVLQCGAKESPLQLASMAATMAQLFIIDALFHEFCRRRPEITERRREEVAQALVAKHI